MIKFGNDIVTVGGDWLKYEEPVPPTPVVDDELLISTDTVTTTAVRYGGFEWYENSTPITYSGNNRYIVHKITLSNAHAVIQHEVWTEDTKTGDILQIMLWSHPTGEPGHYNYLAGLANIKAIGHGNYLCSARSSDPYSLAYTDWTRAYDYSMMNNNNPVIFRFIVDRDTNKVNIYVTSTAPYGATERLIYDADIVVDGTTSMLKSVSSIAPFSTTAKNSSELTTVYVDAKYEMHACSSFDVAIAC